MSETSKMSHIRLEDIVQYIKSKNIGIELRGDPNCIIDSIVTLQNRDITSTQKCISFLSNPKYRKYLTTTNITAVILKPHDLESYTGNALITEDPHLVWAYVSQLFDVMPKKIAGIHPTAVIATSAKIANTATIGPFVVIEDHVVIGENVVIGAHSVIEEMVTIGNDCFLYPRVTICYDCHVGNNVVLHPGAVIGSQGFGFAKGKTGFVNVAQLGRVVLEDDVHVGTNTCVDRGAIENTHLKKGARLDNLVQIGHNVTIGEHSILAGCAGVAGSTNIGNNVMIGGATSINGHIEITDNTIVTGFTMLTHSIHTPGIYSSGLPMMENQEWHRVVARVKKIGTLYNRVKTLEKLIIARDETSSNH